MKYTILLLIAVVLFNSCDITKRRYMPGYSVEWRHKAAKVISTVNQKEPVISHAIVTSRITNIPGNTIVARKYYSQPIPTAKWRLPPPVESSVSLHQQKISFNHIASNSQKYSTNSSAVKESVNGKPVFYTGDEQVDDDARKSLTFGFLSLGIPALTFLIMLGIALSIGDTLAEAPAYAVTIFALGCLGGLIFAVFAIIDGFLAINEINAQPDTFTGTGKAVAGIILGAISAIGVATYLIIKYLF